MDSDSTNWVNLQDLELFSEPVKTAMLARSAAVERGFSTETCT